jgi:hypothetical protein
MRMRISPPASESSWVPSRHRAFAAAVAVVLPLVTLAILLAAQSFDVISIKPSGNEPLPPGYGRGLGFQPGGRYVQIRTQLLTLITEAFGVRSYQIDLSSLPGWASSARYDIDARLEHAPPTIDEATPVSRQPNVPVCSYSMSSGLIHAGGVTMQNLANGIGGAFGLRTRVVDDTGLVGRFDFDLHWTPDRPASADSGNPAAISEWPSIFTAFEDQLGLKLVPRRMEVEVLVIDHAERPTED